MKTSLDSPDIVQIEERKEFKVRMQEIDKEKLQIARYWLGISVTYFFIRVGILTFPRWSLLNYYL